MAIDTADKRASAVHVAMSWRGLLPLPDGALNQADRQQTAFMYRGILASGAVVTPTTSTAFEGLRRNVGRMMR